MPRIIYGWGRVGRAANAHSRQQSVPLVSRSRGLTYKTRSQNKRTIAREIIAVHQAPPKPWGFLWHHLAPCPNPSCGEIVIYVLDPRWLIEGGGHGSFVGGGEDVVYLRVTIRSAANECLGSFYSDRHALLHVRLERPPGRTLSVNNGGHNHHNARTGPWVEGCLFENTGDDVCHINGYLMSVLQQPDRRLCGSGHPAVRYAGRGRA